MPRNYRRRCPRGFSGRPANGGLHGQHECARNILCGGRKELPVVGGFADASIGSGTVGLGVDSNSISVVDNLLTGGVYFSGYGLTSKSSNLPVGFTGVTSEFDLVTLAADYSPLKLYKNTSCRTLPCSLRRRTQRISWSCGFSSWQDGVLQSSSDLIVENDVSIKRIGRITAPRIDTASAASSLTLLLGSLAVLCGRRAIKVGSNRLGESGFKRA